MKLRKKLANCLKKLKGEQTQAQFSRRLGIGQASLNRLLNCEQAATLDMLETICGSLCIDIVDLFGGDDISMKQATQKTRDFGKRTFY